jgi:DNA-binding NtrC family response regulator
MKGDTLATRKDRAMRDLLRRALAEHNGNRTHTARTLAIERTYLLKMINRYGLKGSC